MSPVITDLLDPYRERKEWTMDDLVHAASEVIPVVAGPQERHKVTEVPDARTVRYYIQEGLVDRPHATSGSSALYGYRHLLQLVSIKVLQSLNLPIRRIRGEIKALSNNQLAERLEAWAGVPVASVVLPSGPSDAEPASRRRVDARRFLESLRSSAEVPAARAGRPESRAMSGARSVWSRPWPVAADRCDPALSVSLQDSVEPPPASGWHRFELFPGIELHVKKEIEVPEGPSFLSVLGSRLRAILESLRSAKSKDTD